MSFQGERPPRVNISERAASVFHSMGARRGYLLFPQGPLLVGLTGCLSLDFLWNVYSVCSVYMLTCSC